MNPILPMPAITPPAPPRPRTPTPARLRELLRVVGVLAVVAGVVIEVAAAWHRDAEKTVAREATASIVSAQRAKAGLAAMHAHALRGLLGWAGAAKDYEASRAEVTEGMLTAARNITYDDEWPPVRALLHARGRYERHVAAAQTLQADPARREDMLRHVREADEVLRGQLLKAADALDAINSAHLKTVYNHQKNWGLLAQAAVFAAGLALTGALVWAQVYVRQRFRRLASPPLVLATVVAVGFVGFVMYELVVGRAVLKVAQEDAFVSIHLMWQAKADGFDALADARLRLLDPDRDRQAAAAGRFEQTVQRLGGSPAAADLKTLETMIRRGQVKVPTGLKGHLEAAVRNVTFDGEDKAAAAAVAAFIEFVAVERRVCEQKDAAAVALAAGGGPESLTAAVGRLDDALDRMLAINQQQFDRANGQGSRLLRWCEYLNPLTMAVVFALTALGLVPRLREYAI